jgi:hypothetical protein
LVAPFPWFGGKRRAAGLVWDALGDPGGYVEPFAGSAAVLLARPGWRAEGWRRVETLNDADGWLVNVWRAIRLHPDVLNHWLQGWPVTEVDYHARLAWLQDRRGDGLVPWLEGDPEHCDAKAAAWWLYVVACGIGDPFGPGPWRIIDGHLRKLPHLGDAGRGVNRALPHLGNAGRGVNRALPHLGNAGRGVNRALPHLGDAGQGDDGRLLAYLTRLSQRLARVRITCGDWRRVVQPSVHRAAAGGDGARAIFLDPPYSTSGDLYHHGDPGGTLSADVRDWCTTAPPVLRIVLAGYDTEHDQLLDHGWRKTQGRAGGGAGYSTNPLNGRREQLWLSPACLGHQQEALL